MHVKIGGVTGTCYTLVGLPTAAISKEDEKSELMLKIRATAVLTLTAEHLKHSPDGSSTHVLSSFEPPF